MSDLPSLPRLALIEVRRALASGDAKHGIETRYQGGPERHAAGARRHAARIELGEQFDAESGIRTRAHLIARELLALECEIEIDGDEAGTAVDADEVHEGRAFQVECVVTGCGRALLVRLVEEPEFVATARAARGAGWYYSRVLDAVLCPGCAPSPVPQSRDCASEGPAK